MFNFNRALSNPHSTEKHLLNSSAFLVEDVIVERKTIKHLYLRINPTSGQVCISAPRRMKDVDIARFLQQKHAWIKRKRLQLQDKIQLQSGTSQSLESVRLWGELYPIILLKGPKIRIDLNADKTLCIECKDEQDAENIQYHLSQWLRSQLSERIAVRLPLFEQISGTQVKEWRIRSMKTRWGTCNIRAARIWINAELVQLPPECLDYIILHELVHLLEPSHNARFHALVTEFMPNWREHDTLLKRHLLPR